MTVERVAVSLPASLYEQMEAARVESGQSRSQLVAEAVAEYLTTRRRQALDEASRIGYLLYPETEEEIAMADAAAQAVFAALPWEWDEDDEDTADIPS